MHSNVEMLYIAFYTVSFVWFRSTLELKTLSLQKNSLDLTGNLWGIREYLDKLSHPNFRCLNANIARQFFRFFTFSTMATRKEKIRIWRFPPSNHPFYLPPAFYWLQHKAVGARLYTDVHWFLLKRLCPCTCRAVGLAHIQVLCTF